MNNVTPWSKACEQTIVPREVTHLEEVIHQHQTLYENMCQAYTEVRIFFVQNMSVFSQLYMPCDCKILTVD